MAQQETMKRGTDRLKAAQRVLNETEEDAKNVMDQLEQNRKVIDRNIDRNKKINNNLNQADKLVDKMKNIILEQDENIEESIEETITEHFSPTSNKDTPVIETDVTVTEALTSDEEGPQAEPSPGGSITSNKEEDDNKGDDEEEDDEEPISVTMIKHYRKEYYTIDGEVPQYIYSIEDGDLGDKVGEIKDKKKIFYDKQ